MHQSNILDRGYLMNSYNSNATQTRQNMSIATIIGNKADPILAPLKMPNIVNYQSDGEVR